MKSEKEIGTKCAFTTLAKKMEIHNSNKDGEYIAYLQGYEHALKWVLEDD